MHFAFCGFTGACCGATTLAISIISWPVNADSPGARPVSTEGARRIIESRPFIQGEAAPNFSPSIKGKICLSNLFC